MICTFGDTTDVTWWRELQLPTRADHRRRTAGSEPSRPTAITSDAGAPRTRSWPARPCEQAQRRSSSCSRNRASSSASRARSRHPVKFYERGDRPLEIVTSRGSGTSATGAATPTLRAELLARGRELALAPRAHAARYETWVEGLNGDWLISRQRFFGVPFPRLVPARRRRRSRLRRTRSSPRTTSCPSTPRSDVPPGYTADQRGQPGGFVGDPDVMDTWATSSLTPADRLPAGATTPTSSTARYPMDLRPQAHEIIRTWLFSTRGARALRVRRAAVVERRDLRLGPRPRPQEDVEVEGQRRHADATCSSEYGSDAVRYWAAQRPARGPTPRSTRDR